MPDVLKQWFIVCLQTDEGEDDLKKGTQLLEIYALEIQMYTAQKNNKKLKVVIDFLHPSKYKTNFYVYTRRKSHCFCCCLKYGNVHT